jgi:hypothetical protein
MSFTIRPVVYLSKGLGNFCMPSLTRGNSARHGERKKLAPFESKSRDEGKGPARAEI